MDKNKTENMDDADKKAMETIVEAVTPKAVEAVVAKLKAEKPLRKDIFENGSDSERKELADKKKAAADFLKAMEKGDRAAVKALSAGSSSNGAEMVPTYVSEQVITQTQDYGLVRKYAQKWPMQGVNENIPTFTTATAYRAGSDTAALNSSAPGTGAVQLRAKTLAVVIPISRVLLQNATPHLVDVLTLIASKAIAKYEDEWALLGKASGEGVFQNASVPVTTMSSGNTTYAKATAEDLLTVMDSVDENFINSSMRWAMSLSMLNNLRRLRSVVGSDKQGFLLENLGGQLPPTLWDLPFNTTAVMPKNADSSQAGTKFLALVDWSNVIHGDAMEYTMEMSDQATITDTDGSTQINLWQQNMVALKIWGLIDIQLANAAKAFGVLKTAAS